MQNKDLMEQSRWEEGYQSFYEGMRRIGDMNQSIPNTYTY